jgi:hypothetical protein
MIKLDKKTEQDFLSPEWAKKLQDAGVDMSDATYKLDKFKFSDDYFIATDKDMPDSYQFDGDPIPTYTLSELLYKTWEWIYPTIDGKEYSGGLVYCKDAPFHIFYFDLVHQIDDKKEYKSDYISAAYEHPIESMASVLIQCHEKEIGCKRKDTGDIRYKDHELDDED